MRIKKLELVGFKSFKDRTVIQFDAGITGIVGPNGCGKSNIVDALVWVMGEMSAKHLRGSSMEDVIFAGSETYAPSGLSEVSLTLENDGGPFPAKYLKHSEIMVTRRLHRSGETEYLINKEPARLRDIQEIFMDTGAGSKGFSIVEQGKIGEIITQKPEQRRSLIEEAAGITKFKARKKESQRKLQSTDQNLVRLQDITGELKRQIDSLQRQAKRAERYRELKKRIEDLDLWLSSRTFFDLRETADEAQRVFDEAQAQESQGESELSRFESELELVKLEALELEKLVESKQAANFEVQSKVQKKEMQIQELRFEIEQARRNKEMTGSMLQEQQARKELLERDKRELDQQVTSLRSTLTSLEEDYESKRSGFEEVQSRVTEIDDQLTSERRELFAVGQTLSSLEAKIAGLDAQLDEATERQTSEQDIRTELLERRQEFEERRNKLYKSVENEKQLQLDLSNDAEAFEVNRKSLEEQLRGKRGEVQEFKDKLNEVTSRLYGLENLQANFEGFEEGVKKVMLWQKQQAEVTADGGVQFKPVAEVVEVPSDYELAMEAALGSRLQTLLSDKSSSALQAVDYLKEQKSGRSSFLAVEDHGQRQFTSSPAEEAGVETLLKDVVQSTDSYEKDVQYLLDGVAIVDTIRTALSLRVNYPQWTFVTRDGDTLNAEGVLTGGAKEGADSGVLKRRREIKELSIQKDEWAGKLALASESLKKIEKQLEQVTEDFEGVQKRRQEQEIKVAELKKDFERSENELSNANQAIERQDREITKIDDQIRSLNDRLEELRSNEEETRIRKHELETSAESLEEELKSSKLGFEGLQSAVTDLQVQVASRQQEFRGLENQLAMVTKSLGDLDTQLGRMEEESTKSTESLSTNQILVEEEKVSLEKLIHEADSTKKAVSETRDALEKQLAKMRELEQGSSQALKQRNSLQHQMNEAQLKLEQAKMKEDNLIEQMRERYMIEFADVAERYRDRDEDPGEATKELKDLREKLSRIGEVNLSAIEEYEETSQRYEFLSQQQEDLIQAKEQLRKVIDRINRICTRRFRETYDLVNERFQKVFPVLFGGGEARLELIEDTEKGEMGIDIVAKPPGKKMQNVTLMSGGEKALTAVSLIFSIFLVKPSPYCLLDEVDAPLDDANVSRFNDLVREMAKRSQIIVVTHNKYTMDVAGHLYGVTMQERGVSKMVSVNLAELS